MEALRIEKEAGHATNFREPMQKDHCVASLQNKSLYEAAMPVFKLNPMATTWQGQPMPGSDVGWAQYEAAETFWTEAALNASGSDEKSQMLIFEGFLPTAVQTLAEIESGAGLVNMPSWQATAWFLPITTPSCGLARTRTSSFSTSSSRLA